MSGKGVCGWSISESRFKPVPRYRVYCARPGMRWDRGGHPTRGQYNMVSVHLKSSKNMVLRHHQHSDSVQYQPANQPRCLIHLQLSVLPSVISALPWVSSKPVTVLSLTFITLLACHPSVVAPDLSSGTPFLQCRPASVSCNIGKLCPMLQAMQMCVIKPFHKRGTCSGSCWLCGFASTPYSLSSMPDCCLSRHAPLH